MRSLPTSRSIRRAPRGTTLFSLLISAITVFLTGGIGLAILATIDANTCDVNVFWGCSDNGGGGGGATIGGALNSKTLCVSAPNSCGQRNVGTLKTTYSCPDGYTCKDPDTGESGCTSGFRIGSDAPNCYKLDPNQDGNQYVRNTDDKSSRYVTVPATENQTCSATPPSESQCQVPPTTNYFHADPSTVGPDNTGTTLSWDTKNSQSCTVAGDNGFSYTSKKDTDSVATGVLTQTTTFTLTCKNGSYTTSKSIRVIVDPHYKEI